MKDDLNLKTFTEFNEVLKRKLNWVPAFLFRGGNSELSIYFLNDLQVMIAHHARQGKNNLEFSREFKTAPSVNERLDTHIIQHLKFLSLRFFLFLLTFP